jgi:hypothetical protein
MFDRGNDEWNAIVTDTQAFLEDQARLRRVTSYTDVNTALAAAGHSRLTSPRRGIAAPSEQCWAMS